MSEFDHTPTIDTEEPTVINRVKKEAIEPHYLTALIQGFNSHEAHELSEIVMREYGEQETVASPRALQYLKFHRWVHRNEREVRGNTLNSARRTMPIK